MLEICVLIGAFSLLIGIGFFSVSFSQRRESQWAFSTVIKKESTSKTPQTDYTTKIEGIGVSNVQLEDNSKNKKQVVNNENTGEFTHSEVTDEVINNLNQIVNSIKLATNNYTYKHKDSHLDN